MKTVLLAGLLLLSGLGARAQLYRITPADQARRESYLFMRDGTVLKGQVLRQDSSLISVRRRGGSLSFVEADQVLSISDRKPEGGLIEAADAGSERPRQVFVMRDGARVEGTLVKRDSVMLTVRKPDGRFTYFEPELLLRVDTVGVDSTDLLKGAQPPGGDAVPFAPWLLTGTSAQLPAKGQFYYRNTWLLMSNLTYGITSWWSIGTQFVTPLPFVDPGSTLVNTANVYQANNRLITQIGARLAPGIHAALLAGFRRPAGFTGARGEGTLQGLLTLGEGRATAMLGYGLILTSAREFTTINPWSSTYPQTVRITTPNRSFVTLGIMQPIGSRLTFVSDNVVRLDNLAYYDDSNWNAQVSLALRIERPRHAFDLGLLGLGYKENYASDKAVRVLPYFGYNLRIGR